jgi:ribosomal protein L27
VVRRIRKPVGIGWTNAGRGADHTLTAMKQGMLQRWLTAPSAIDGK